MVGGSEGFPDWRGGCWLARSATSWANFRSLNRLRASAAVGESDLPPWSIPLLEGYTLRRCRLVWVLANTR